MLINYYVEFINVATQLSKCYVGLNERVSQSYKKNLPIGSHSIESLLLVKISAHFSTISIFIDLIYQQLIKIWTDESLPI